MRAGVYYLCFSSGRFYVGSSLDVERRLKEHFRKLRKQVHHNQRVQNEFNDFGSPRIFCMFTDKYLDKEQEILDATHGNAKCLNIRNNVLNMADLNCCDVSVELKCGKVLEFSSVQKCAEYFSTNALSVTWWFTATRGNSGIPEKYNVVSAQIRSKTGKVKTAKQKNDARRKTPVNAVPVRVSFSDGIRKTFTSVTQVSKYLKVDRSVVYAWLSGKSMSYKRRGIVDLF